ncbi:hypothetical protein F2Q70_00003074 [Brassica cretica]|uniref:Uncharacterized protein n=2 Tax=Brassica cretica TaxID=69181 RepID=A0A3N6QHM7_BRACR|nr:hypothetical protein F2Q68_00020736 [Brassica cretica]KAF2571115.1 hypothetical protein F2Q70_00003074 [Brassica cretica]KAF3568462.1 hypothetical protein DY000_02014765 [Brassica cretica]
MSKESEKEMIGESGRQTTRENTSVKTREAPSHKWAERISLHSFDESEADQSSSGVSSTIENIIATSCELPQKFLKEAFLNGLKPEITEGQAILLYWLIMTERDGAET